MSTRVQAGFGLLQWSGHLAIVFTNNNEDVYTVEGMPERNPFGGNAGRIMMRGPFEDQTLPQIVIPGEYRETGEFGATFIEVAEGEDVCGLWTCLKNKMQLIDSMDIPYDPWRSNSNTAVYSAIKACNLPTSGPQYDVGMWRTHLGWGIDLFDIRPVPVPTPPRPIGTPESPGIPVNPTEPDVPPIPTPNPLSTSTPAGT